MNITWDNPSLFVRLANGAWVLTGDESERNRKMHFEFRINLPPGHPLRAEIEHAIMTSLTRCVCGERPTLAFLYWLLLLINSR
jgi:hypothetical protein